MEIQLTARAAAEYDFLRDNTMTPAMAAEYLRDGRIALRTFSETLREQYIYPDLESRLVSSFRCYDTGVDDRSVARNVSNWVRGKSQPRRREDIFRICFSLDLTEAQANLLLGQCTEYGIHYREPRDVIYTWFLRNDRGYMEARDFFSSLPPAPRLTEYPAGCSAHITREVQSVFAGARNPEELRRVYLANLDKFGQLHVRAYRYFDKYLNILIHPDTGWDKSAAVEEYSLETIMERYLSLHMPSGRSRLRYSVVQKLVKQNWPNSTALKDIRAHREDVSRKLLLLLYIITENVVDDEYHEADEDYLSLQDRLEDHWWVLNAILIDCGMPTLDPRNAFDWLILYAMTADEDESMSERMSQVIDHLFADLQ
ncbi:MAG: hypothetical protein LUI10_00005 [Lachnospiraceae bacterium]|nr:hypothetical protein [Lachnospiraceae bacterium]